MKKDDALVIMKICGDDDDDELPSFLEIEWIGGGRKHHIHRAVF